MKKTLLLLTLLIGAALSTYAQNDDSTPKLGVGFNIGAAVGGPASQYPVAGGVHVKFEYPLSDSQLSLIVKVGYTFFVTANGYDYESDGYGDSYSEGSILSFAPIEVGAKYYIVNKLFVEGEVGASIGLSSYYTDDNGNVKSISRVSPIISPNVGYTIPFGSTRASLDVSAGFDASPQTGGGFNQVGVKATFNFGL